MNINTLPEKIIMEVDRCEEHQRLHFYATDETVDLLKALLKKVGVELVIDEKPPIISHSDNNAQHKMRILIDQVFEIQGIKRVEGQSILAALESLIEKYAQLKC